uniref:Secreted protein n=1 Tax=Caenorhabditis tropicalis TaxID=1561998 RepID=A0A1I7U6N8_9PELO
MLVETTSEDDAAGPLRRLLSPFQFFFFLLSSCTITHSFGLQIEIMMANEQVYPRRPEKRTPIFPTRYCLKTQKAKRKEMVIKKSNRDETTKQLNIINRF